MSFVNSMGQASDGKSQSDYFSFTRTLAKVLTGNCYSVKFGMAKTYDSTPTNAQKYLARCLM